MGEETGVDEVSVLSIKLNVRVFSSLVSRISFNQGYVTREDGKHNDQWQKLLKKKTIKIKLI